MLSSAGGLGEKELVTRVLLDCTSQSDYLTNCLD